MLAEGRDAYNFVVMKRMILILCVLTAAANLRGQMTLNDCLIYAREHAYANRIDRLADRDAAADVRLAAAQVMPYLSLSANGNLSSGRNIDPETNTYDNKQTLASGFGLNLSIPLFDGLVNINNLKAARVARKKTAQRILAAQDEVSIEVVKAFYNVSYCKSMVAQMEEQLTRDREDLLATEKSFTLGTKSGADVAEIKALVASDEFSLINQKNLLAKAYLALRAGMGMELSEEPLDLVEDDPGSYGDGSDIRRHPKIAEAELAVEEGIYTLRAAKGSYSPQISLTGGISTSYYKLMGMNMAYPSFRRQWKDNMGEYVGVQFSFPLFDGLSTSGRVRKASVALQESRLRLEQTRYELDRNVREAQLDYVSSCEESVAAQKRLEAEEFAFKAVRRKYELGQSSAIDLYTSAAKLATARADAEGKRIQKIINMLTLRYCKGENLIRE